jgi:hypothetical protein
MGNVSPQRGLWNPRPNFFWKYNPRIHIFPYSNVKSLKQKNIKIYHRNWFLDQTHLYVIKPERPLRGIHLSQ